MLKISNLMGVNGMKEIKLRAWDEDKQVLSAPFTLDEVYTSQDDSWIDIEDMSYVFQKTLIECTGFKDKNGADVYDKDIVEFKFGREHCRAIVSYDEVSARWIKTFITPYGIDTKDLSSYASSQRVIGNTLKHPELVKGLVI